MVEKHPCLMSPRNTLEEDHEENYHCLNIPCVKSCVRYVALFHFSSLKLGQGGPGISIFR